MVCESLLDKITGKNKKGTDDSLPDFEYVVVSCWQSPTVNTPTLVEYLSCKKNVVLEYSS